MSSGYFPHKFSLNGRTAFVVGGSGLIGIEISKALVSAGATTIILDINNQNFTKLAREFENLHFKHFDSANIEKCEDQFATLLENYNCPDVFINCSYPRTKDWGSSSFRDVTLKSFRENVDVHMNSYAWLARLAAEAMVKENHGGSIIQFSSTYGIVGQDLSVYKDTNMHENMTYATIKGGIVNLTRQMASYYGQFNIRVNSICPGGLEGHVAGKSDTQDMQFVKNYNSKVPLKRLGKAEEVASVALFLASDAASYITGATIMVDGGWTAI